MSSSASRSVVVLGCAAVVSIYVAGCSGLVGLVVDDSSPVPGGTLQAAIAGQAPLDVVALAQGDPMTITGQSENIVVSMTCGEDSTGRGASAVLATAGSQITLMITSATRSTVQVHAGGSSCVAQTGEIDLTADATTALTGTFTGTGVTDDGTTPCTMNGTLTAIPQHR